MHALALILAIMLLGIGGAVLIALFSGGVPEPAEHPDAFAILPVPEDTPAARAHLEHYASQIAWMDAEILRCVILVNNPQTRSLCEELSRDYECYRTMTCRELQQFLAERCGVGEIAGKC